MVDSSEAPPSADSANGNELKVFLRDTADFLCLPLEYRWEFTRRHPYYLRFWKWASRANPERVPQTIQKSAIEFLHAINLVADPPSPALSYRELESAPPVAAYEGGALAPITYRAYVVLIGKTLSHEGLQLVADKLQELAKAAGQNDQLTRNQLIRDIAAIPFSELDQIPNPGVISFRPRAPTNAIVEDLRRHVEKVKRDYGIEESRRRDDKLPEYQAVWDLREGWTGSGYDPTQEKTFKEIAQDLKISESTATSRYQSAFKLITGHDYQSDAWWTLFGPLKLPLITVLRWARGSRHPWRNRAQRPVASAALGTAGDYLFNNLGVADEERDVRELLLDIKEQISSGRTDDQIASILNCDAVDARKIVEYVRRKSD